MLKSPSPSGDSLFSQMPSENAKSKVDRHNSSGSSCFDEEESSASTLEIAPINEKSADSYAGGCVKNEPVDTSADLLLDDSLRLQIERCIEIVVNEFSLDSASCNLTTSDANGEVPGNDSNPEKANQCVVDSSVIDSSADKNADESEEPPRSSSRSFDLDLTDSNSLNQDNVETAGISLASETPSHTSVPHSNHSGTPNVKSEPRDANQSHSLDTGSLSIIPCSKAPPASSSSSICPNGSSISADYKPYQTLRSSCLYSSSTKPSDFASSPSLTISSITPPRTSTSQMDKITNNVCQVSVKPIPGVLPSTQLPAIGYSQHTTLLESNPRRLGPDFISSTSFPDCCDSSKLSITPSQFPSESPRYQMDTYSGCVVRKTDPYFSSCSSLSSTLATSTPSATSCFCTNSCYGKPCSRLPLQNQLLSNSSLSQRALNLHNSYELYPKGVATSIPGPASQPFDYYRPKSSGPSCFRMPSSPVSKFSLPHLPPKEPLSPHISSLSACNDAIGSKSPSFFSPTSPKSLKSWCGSSVTTAACMLPSSAVSQSPYKFRMTRIPLSSPSSLPSSYVHSTSLSAPPSPQFPGFADPNNLSAPRLYNGTNGPPMINSTPANTLKSSRHQQPAVLQQYPFGSSMQKSQCCFPSQLQCYTNCCKEAQQFSFV